MTNLLKKLNLYGRKIDYISAIMNIMQVFLSAINNGDQ